MQVIRHRPACAWRAAFVIASVAIRYAATSTAAGSPCSGEPSATETWKPAAAPAREVLGVLPATR